MEIVELQQVFLFVVGETLLDIASEGLQQAIPSPLMTTRATIYLGTRSFVNRDTAREDRGWNVPQTPTLNRAYQDTTCLTGSCSSRRRRNRKHWGVCQRILAACCSSRPVIDDSSGCCSASVLWAETLSALWRHLWSWSITELSNAVEMR